MRRASGAELVAGVFATCLLLGCAEPEPASTGSTDTQADAAQPDVFTPDTSDANGMPCLAGPCDDGDPCTTDDHCQNGECLGTPMDCDDGVPCTTDRCVGGACTHPLTAGRWCRIDGVCIADGDASPDDPCLGCVAPVSPTAWSHRDGGTCSDGSVCTLNDRCTDGACRGSPITCDDDNPCTDDACDATSGCTAAPRQGACEDGDFCTIGDQCVNASCIPGGTLLVCTDDEPCTVDECLGDLGCRFTPHSGPCDDGNPCTTGEHCSGGVCAGNFVPTDCDDQNPCTDDVCLPQAGCVAIPNLASCDDGEPCSLDDRCSAGSCLAGKTALPCDDAEVCTQDLCVAGQGCIHPPVATASPCDDGDPCTTADGCLAGACVGSLVADCDDGDVCTDDLCTTETGCAHISNTASCDDGNPCTLDERCVDGACSAQGPLCDDGNACTSDVCDSGACTHLPSNAVGCRVDIRITSPLRAARLGGSKVVTVKGFVTSPAGFITSASLNGEALAVSSSGHFVRTVVATPGINVLRASATDSLGNTASTSQSFLFATDTVPVVPGFPAGSAISGALGVMLGATVIDDGDHGLDDLDDLGSIVEATIAGLDLATLMPNPLMDSAEYRITHSDLATGAPAAQLVPQANGLRLTLIIPNVSANLHAQGLCAFCPNASGSLALSQLVVSVSLTLGVQGGAPTVSLAEPLVALVGLDVDLDGIIGDILDPLVDYLVDEYTQDIAQDFKSQLQTLIPPLMSGALASLAFETSFDVPGFVPGAASTTVNLDTGLQALEFDEDGGMIRLWAAATPSVITNALAQGPFGSVLRDGCGTGSAEVLTLAPGAPLQVAVADDLLNQLLYSLWAGGAFSFPVPADWLAGALPPDSGFDDLSLSVDFLLPPVLSACGVTPELQLGDIRVRALVGFGAETVEIDIFVSAIAWAQVSGANGLGLQIDDLASLDTDIVVNTPGFAATETLVAALVADQITPLVLDLLGSDALSGFPLPAIDLGAQVPGLPSAALTPVIEQVFRSSGWTVLAGDVQ